MRRRKTANEFEGKHYLRPGERANSIHFTCAQVMNDSAEFQCVMHCITENTICVFGIVASRFRQRNKPISAGPHRIAFGVFFSWTHFCLARNTKTSFAWNTVDRVDVENEQNHNTRIVHTLRAHTHDTMMRSKLNECSRNKNRQPELKIGNLEWGCGCEAINFKGFSSKTIKSKRFAVKPQMSANPIFGVLVKWTASWYRHRSCVNSHWKWVRLRCNKIDVRDVNDKAMLTHSHTDTIIDTTAFLIVHVVPIALQRYKLQHLRLRLFVLISSGGIFPKRKQKMCNLIRFQIKMKKKPWKF